MRIIHTFFNQIRKLVTKKRFAFFQEKKHNIFLFKKEILRVEHDNGKEIKVDGTY